MAQVTDPKLPDVEKVLEVPAAITRRGDFPNTLGPLGGEQRTGLAPATDQQVKAVQENEEFYRELKEYSAERKPETTSWKTTQDDPLPASDSKQFPFGRDVPQFDAKPGKVSPIMEPDAPPKPVDGEGLLPLGSHAEKK